MLSSNEAGGAGHARVSSPYDWVLEAQLGGSVPDLLVQPGLGADQVLDELRHPPDGGVAVETVEAVGEVLGDGQGQVRGPRVQAVHDGQLHYLHVTVISLA